MCSTYNTLLNHETSTHNFPLGFKSKQQHFLQYNPISPDVNCSSATDFEVLAQLDLSETVWETGKSPQILETDAFNWESYSIPSQRTSCVCVLNDLLQGRKIRTEARSTKHTAGKCHNISWTSAPNDLTRLKDLMIS